MFAPVVSRFNRASLWHRRVRIEADLLRATSFDRLVYLWRWRWLESRSAETAFIRSLLRPGMRVVDAGANLGAYAHLFARCVGPTGRVTAFEPDPTLFAALETNARNNQLPQLQAHRLALGAHAGRAKLNHGFFNSGDNRLAAPDVTTGTGLEITVTTLDDFLDGTPVDFIKIDVQGWEEHALRGMVRTLAANPHVQLYLELWPHGLCNIGSSPASLLALLTEMGFQFEIRPGNQAPSSLDFAALARRYYWFADIYAWRGKRPSTQP
jgi:FkbM family methyltransferase